MRRLAKSKSRLHQAFETEALVHLDALHRYAMYLCHNPRDAEDLVQETMLKAFRFFDRYELGTRCKAWLFRIMTNTFLNSHRKKVKQFPFMDNIDQIDHDSGDVLGWSEFYVDPETRVMSRAFHGVVIAALDELPDDFRTVVLLADLEGFAYKEIAEITNCPVGTVMSRLHRGRKAMQRRLADFAIREGIIKAPPKPRHRPRTAAPDENAAAAVSLAEFKARQGGSR